MPSLPPSPTRAQFEPSRRSESAPFFMHVEAAGGCLVPGDSMDGPMPDLSSKKTRRGVYADYRRWFSRKASPVPVMEKDHPEDPESRNRVSKFEQRLQVGSWYTTPFTVIHWHLAQSHISHHKRINPVNINLAFEIYSDTQIRRYPDLYNFFYFRILLQGRRE
ncbi:hypothetical protein R3P38DRAFT_2782240 [Favolaschia claudopus]|uniref:Uncharacterized protein n=1 Tax=Favolaschia claudopus TaxID=2862362 RepID=A0AAW0B5E8_9AGAR